MHKITIKRRFKDKIISLPSAYSEIPLSLRVFICQQQLDREQTKYFLLKHYIGKYYEQLPAELLVQIYDLMLYIDTPPLDPLIPEIKYRGSKYYAGAAKLEFTTALEFVMMTEYLDKIIHDQQEEHIYHLAAVIYRPKSWRLTASGDTRSAILNRSMINDRANHFSKLKPDHLQSALIYASASRAYIHGIYGRKLFTAPASDIDNSKTSAGLGWHHTFMDIAESGTFGNLSDIYQQNIHTLLAYLLKKKKEADELKASRPKNTHS